MARKKKTSNIFDISTKKVYVQKSMYAIISDTDNGVEYVTIGNEPEVFEIEADAYVRISELNRKEKELFGGITSKYQIVPYVVEGVI